MQDSNNFCHFKKNRKKTVKTFLTQAILARVCDSGSGHGDLALTGSPVAAVADGWSPPVRARIEANSRPD
jgi:hypothetical protein